MIKYQNTNGVEVVVHTVYSFSDDEVKQILKEHIPGTTKVGKVLGYDLSFIEKDKD